MSRRRRFLIVSPAVIMAVSIAGCIGFTGDPTRAPSDAAAPSPGPTRTFLDFSSFTPYPVITPTPVPCPPRPSGWSAGLSFDRDSGIETVALDAETSPTPTVLWPARGGSQVPGELSIEELDGDPGLSIVAFAVEFFPRDGSAATRIEATFHGTTFTMAFPDLDLEGTLEFHATWTTRCGTGSGVGTGALVLVSTATVAACPHSEDASNAYLDARQPRMSINGAPVPTAVLSGTWLWDGGGFAVDTGTAFPLWDRHAQPLTGRAGSAALVGITGDGSVATVDTSFYTLDDALHEFDRNIAPIAERETNLSSDGTGRLTLPTTAGRYVTASGFRWQTSCLTADSTANAELDLR